ncbi:Serine/threonine protein kinase [Phytophthora megakarya]|uniref:Serine/threonine protein kinase n=1 Tax=Phytophthora megakarya TaxID=4795 RepID=A0A225VED9_9STRA|nr:Serine/threonine protein kinase [Phytophthora megakarya]
MGGHGSKQKKRDIFPTYNEKLSSRIELSNPLLVAVGEGDVEQVRALVESGEDVNQENSHKQTPLMKAAGDGNLPIFRYLMESGADIDLDTSDDERKTVLIHAIENGNNLNIIRFLVRCGADVNHRDTWQNTSLLYATRRCKVDVVQFIVECGADVKASGYNGFTPLMIAAIEGALEIVTFLVQVGMDVNSVDNDKRTALFYAIQYRHLDVARFLLESGAIIDGLRSSLYAAIWQNNFKAVKLLVKFGANIHVVDNEGSTPLIRAVEKADLGIIKFLIESGADVNAVNNVGKSSLMKASEGGNLKAVHLLVENGADVKAADINKWTPITFAGANGMIKIVRYLVASGAYATDLENNKMKMLVYAVDHEKLDAIRHLLGGNRHINITDKRGKTLLMRAAGLGRVDMVRLLHKVLCGADINAKDPVYGIPLLYASKGGNLDVVRFLVERGANVNACEKSGLTALLYAAQHAQLDIIHFLVGKGADVNATTNNGSTSLLYAARMNNNSNAVRCLVEAGADINVIHSNNRTPLIEAVDAGNLAVVQLLVNRGAEINVVDKYGWTALMFAVQNDNFDVVQCLVDGGADVSMTNKEDQTAIFMATTRGYTDIRCLLLHLIPHIHPIVENVPAQCLIPPFEVKLQKFVLSENVGGSYRALWLDAEVVVKLFVPQASTMTFAHEVVIWHQLRHPNVIKLYGACDVGHHFFVCEWASNGSLVEYLSVCEKRGIEKLHGSFCMKQLWVSHTYTNEKSSNILVGNDGLAKLTDFQMSGSMTTRLADGRSDVEWGSFRWQSPELLKGEAVSFASDIYSVGLCIMAVVTGEIPWEDDNRKLMKEVWDPVTDPRYCVHMRGMTGDLEMLVSKTCGNDPRSRVSAGAVVRILERLAIQECHEHQLFQLEPELTTLLDVASNVAVKQPQHALHGELKTLYERFTTENRPVRLLEQFYKLVADSIDAIDAGSQEHRILELSYTKAQSRRMTAFYRRIDAIWDAINDTHWGERKNRRGHQRLQQHEVFISEVTQSLVVLNELETEDARKAFVTILKTEIDSHGSSYTASQLTILEKAYNDLNRSINSNAVAKMPEWFLPWYELEFDGANCFTEVKQVKFASSDNSESWTNHSISASTSPRHIVEKTHKEIREMFEHEVDVWFGLSHPHVVRLFGACHIGTPLFACEYASNGSLDNSGSIRTRYGKSCTRQHLAFSISIHGILFTVISNATISLLVETTKQK